ncbi:8-oxo-dGTP diphosphatase MutT [Anthocerotibacter panamensis]|uniref:8-oxo-dGTP diphosphatase MutT n=1 Tax=Anthocerotibacter panamensis TaxID=2857077 RepID=UPI001C4079BF|nr:8-oxo-dGTP diphosphatase MutT [Anthocerotibacter panamensis]
MNLPHKSVVVGLIVRDRKVLIDRRLDQGFLGGMWELPGGKVEPGETPEAAVAREIAEELNIQVAVGELLTVVEHPYPQFTLTLRCYRCDYRAGTPETRASQEIRWVCPKELTDFPFPPATVELFARIGNFLAGLKQSCP